MRSTRLPLLFAAAAVLLPLIAYAQPVRLVTTARAIEWQAPGAPAVAVLSVQRPDGEVTAESFAAGQTPMLRLDGLADGAYAYELRVTQADGAPLVQSGSFTIANGTMLSPSARERNLRETAETFFADDVSAAGGVCAGADCTNAESYAGVTVKLKANNTRLRFEDTSTLAGFPTTDWQLSANDPASGGANKFFVEDLAAATVPFLIEGATPTNTLYVDSNRRIGINTSTPAKALTISDTPMSPTIRMQQGASPFQAWDVLASDVNFWVRDVNHEVTPFVIKTSAPNDTLLLDSTGRIGLGVASPLYQIHHSSGARLDAGNWVNASSRGVKQNVVQLDSAAALDTLKALQPVTFAYKANPAETHVGFIAEDVPELVATTDRKGLSSMDVAAVLTKVIQEQQRTIEDLQTRLGRLERNE